MAGNNTFVWKPSSIGAVNRGGLAVILPSQLTGGVSNLFVKTPTGQTIKIPRTGNSDGRDVYKYPKPGGSFPAGSQVVAQLSNGQEQIWDINDTGNRFESAYTGAGSSSAGSSTPSTQNINDYSPQTATSPGGNAYQTPGMFDFSQIPAAQVDFNTAWDFASQVGQQNKQAYMSNITSPATKEAALGLVGTDIEGIKMGIDQLVPAVRAAGDADTQTNIQRAGAIDAANIARIPGINKFNISQAAETNKFNQAQQIAAVESSGLDYRKRITDVLDQLKAQSTGRLAPDMDKALTTEMRNRGADMTSAAGVSPLSLAGVRAQDRLNIMERMQLMQTAQQTIPGVLQSAQSTLQAPTERVPTVYASPTNVPLNMANIAERLPVQSSISAGAAQQAIGTAATNYEVIPATTALNANLGSQEYNASNQYARDMAVGRLTQAQYGAIDTAAQEGLNLDRSIAEQQAAEEAKIQGAAVADIASGTVGGVAGGLASIATGSPVVGSLIGAAANWATSAPASKGTQTTGSAQGAAAPSGGAVSPSVAANDASWIDAAASGGASLAPGAYNASNQYGGGRIMVDNLGNVSSQANAPVAPSMSANFGNRLSEVGGYINSGIDAISNIIGGDWWGTKSKPTTKVPESGNFKMGSKEIPATEVSNHIAKTQDFLTGNSDIKSKVLRTPEAISSGLDSNGEQRIKAGEGNSILDSAIKPLKDPKVDQKIIQDTSIAVKNWSSLAPTEQLKSSSTVGILSLADRGLVSDVESKQMQGITNALTTISNPQASDQDKTIALAQASQMFATNQFSGSIDQPSTINGSKVIGEGMDNTWMVETSNGQTAYIPKDSLATSANIGASLQSYSILNSKASDEDKLLALTSVGVETAAANQIIKEVNAGNVNAGLLMFNTAKNWEEMNPVEKSVSTMQSSYSVMNALDKLNPQAVASDNPLSFAMPSSETIKTLGNFAQGVGGAYGVYKGVQTASTVLEAVDDMPQSRAVKQGAQGLTMSGAMIGGGAGAIASAVGAGAAIGSAVPVPVVGTVIGAAVGLAAGLTAGLTGTGKNASQLQRDAWRKGISQLGITDKNWNVSLANGSTYDIGKDGNATLKNTDGTERRTTDIDWSNKLAMDAIPQAHLFSIATGLNPTDNQKLGIFDSVTGQVVNAATSNAKNSKEVTANYRAMLDKAGIDPINLATKVEILRATNKINDQEYGVYLSQLNNMYGSKFVPSSKEQFRQGIIERLQNKTGRVSKYDKQLLAELTDAKKLAANEKAMNRRFAKMVEAQQEAA